MVDLQSTLVDFFDKNFPRKSPEGCVYECKEELTASAYLYFRVALASVFGSLMWLAVFFTFYLIFHLSLSKKKKVPSITKPKKKKKSPDSALVDDISEDKSGEDTGVDEEERMKCLEKQKDQENTKSKKTSFHVPADSDKSIGNSKRKSQRVKNVETTLSEAEITGKSTTQNNNLGHQAQSEENTQNTEPGDKSEKSKN